MTLSEIQIRDPYVLPVASRGAYYLYGTTDKDCWGGPAVGFDTYRSRDLQEWEGPIHAFRPPPDFWATMNFWAPEVHEYNGRFYMFASFAAPQRHRCTEILVADEPEGPFEPWSDGPITPAHWQCLDATLYVDEAGNPWTVFCQEWVQIHDGAMHAMRLSTDLKRTVGRPIFLFNASEAPWVSRNDWPAATDRMGFPHYVTDGPFLYKTTGGSLLMLWSSFGARGYAMGIARSESGTPAGPWTHDPEPLWAEDGGHGMIFRTFDGRLFLTLHQPNDTPNERAAFHELEERNDSLFLKSSR